ncbi:MAG: outer membrane protein assembly factor BamA [Desulfobacterales bacterium]|nr:outer membrane protein assembly factor BamA [Desulfobacterales bacterium]
MKSYIIIFLVTSFHLVNTSLVFSQSTKNDVVISSIHIDIKNGYANTPYLENLAKDMLTLKPSDRFFEQALLTSIESLKSSKKFSEIDVDSVEKEDNTMELIFVLTAFNYIKDIRIKGMYPLFEREILNFMSVYTGSVYRSDEVFKQEKLISDLYENNGFYHTQVNIKSSQDITDGNYHVHITINRGHFFRINHVTIKNNRAYSQNRLKLKIPSCRMSLVPGLSGRFIENKFRKEIRELQKNYWENGYPEASVEFEIKKDDCSRTVDILLNVNEGPEYDVRFSGNKEFWGFTLKKEVTIFEKGNYHDSGIRRSITNIENLYKKHGYMNAQITYHKDSYNIDKTKRYILFKINEGICSLVESITISGNKAFNNDRIQKQLLTRPRDFLAKGAYVPDIVKDDLGSIKALYLDNGYLSADIHHEVTFSKNKDKAFITMNIKEGIQTIVDDIQCKGLSAISKQTAMTALLLKKGKPLQKSAIQKDETELLALISEKGYPHTEIKSEVIMNKDHSKATIIFTIQEGKFVKMGKAYVGGNFKTKDSVMQKEFTLNQGEPFSLKKTIQGQQYIRNMDIFNSVSFRTHGFQEKGDKIDIFVDVEEKKPYFIELCGGYESEKGNFFNSKLGDHNLFGENKDGWLYGELSEIGYKGELGIVDPIFLGTTTSASWGLYTDKKEEFNQDFGLVTFGSSLGLKRKVLQSLSAGVSFKFERRDQFHLDSSTAKEQFDDEYSARSIVMIIPSLSYDSRDSFIVPKKGIFSSINAEISKGLSNSRDDFVKYKCDARKYWTVFKPVTFAFLFRAGYIDVFHADSKIPDDQLFYLGGISSVRGFKENMLYYDSLSDPIGGRNFWSGSIEARIDIGFDFELSGFYDIGNINEPFETIQFDDTRSSMGLGLRYITPIGPIGLMYGIKLDSKDGESKGRLHFSLGYTF